MRKHKSDLVILFATLGLMALGLIVIYAIGPMRANVLNSTYGSNYGQNDFFFGQLRSVILSLVAFFIAFKLIPYKYIQKFYFKLYVYHTNFSQNPRMPENPQFELFFQTTNYMSFL